MLKSTPIIMILSITNTYTYIISFLCAFFLFLSFHYSSAKDNLTIGESIQDGADYLESPGKKFQMGFFPNQVGFDSERRYVGIWYTMDPKTVVWVANRDNPVPDSTGVLKITEDGEVKVLQENHKVYFETKTGGVPMKMLKLLDSGNAVLIDVASGSKIWESFLQPTDTFLPGMKMDPNSLKLTSWKRVDDPGIGSLVFQEEETRQYTIFNTTDGNPLWRSGSGSMNNFEPYQMFTEAYNLLSNSSLQSSCKQNSIRYCNLTSYPSYDYSRLLMNYTGNIQFYSWDEQDKQWNLEWQEPKDNCSTYQVCGPFGLCSASNNTPCSCLQGFEAVSPGDPSAGCKHKSEKCGKDDTFNNISMIKVANPTRSFGSNNDTYCKKKCLETCRCKAYSYTSGNRQPWSGRSGITNSCWIWDSDPYNLQTDGIHNIFIRISAFTEATGYYNQEKESPIGKSSSFLTETKIMIFPVAILVILFVCILSYIYYKRVIIRQQGENTMLQMDNNERRAIELLDLQHSREDNTEDIGIPFFHFASILAATDNFSDANKLGEGGFGPVYRGKLPGGLEVAIKRLSSYSGQGLEEFRNEVILIAKLQHRNLVRLLGYCMQGNEKMLLYEYMPNKSLDAFIFGYILLDWAKRYEIIVGIARGLLYLHQDSRLRIIHRDLKTSNILLDEDMCPKISDFGLAKIVQGREVEATTNRVIGTYGYMAPEYALDGLFSIKSDVFSFGVVVLEIISGKKNTGYSQFQQNLSLLRYAWSLWKEDMPFELMDQKLLESRNSNEVLKCIIIGLLCVQEDPGSRPTMTNVVLMLGGDISSLPTPTQPAFVARRTMSSSSSSSNKPRETQTNNILTITLQEGR